MIFEFDPSKNTLNQAKHGISFEEAQSIWNDPDLIILHGKKKGEKRFLALGEAYSVIYTVVHTKRGDAIRIISARKTTQKEALYYFEKRRDHD